MMFGLCKVKKQNRKESGMKDALKNFILTVSPRQDRKV